MTVTNNTLTTTPATNPPSTTTDISGFVVVAINGNQIMVPGRVSGGLNVAYRAESWQTAQPIGTIDGIIKSVTTTFGVDDFEANYNSIKDTLSSSGLDKVVNALTTATIRLTALVIQTSATQNYFEFGLTLDLTTSNPRVDVAGVSLDAFGFTVKATRKKTPPQSQSGSGG